MVTVASLLQIMDSVGSLDSSRDLQPIHAKIFVNRLHLVLQIGKIPTQKILRLRVKETKQGLKLVSKINEAFSLLKWLKISQLSQLTAPLRHIER